MFVIDVGDSVDELIKIIDTRTFPDPGEMDQLIRDFFINHEKSLRIQIEEKIERIEKLKQSNKKIEFRQEYNAVMEEIDIFILNRRLHFENISKKISNRYGDRYKGRYKKRKINGNTQGKTRNNKSIYNKKAKATQ